MDFKQELSKYQKIINNELEKYVKHEDCPEKILNNSCFLSLSIFDTFFKEKLTYKNKSPINDINPKIRKTIKNIIKLFIKNIIETPIKTIDIANTIIIKGFFLFS